MKYFFAVNFKYNFNPNNMITFITNIFEHIAITIITTINIIVIKLHNANDSNKTKTDLTKEIR